MYQRQLSRVAAETHRAPPWQQCGFVRAFALTSCMATGRAQHAWRHTHSVCIRLSGMRTGAGSTRSLRGAE